MSLPRFGVAKPVPVNLLMAALIIGGLVAAMNLRREFFPETTPEQAQVTLPYPGATPREIEETLAIKVEDKLADLDEVDRLTTTLTEGGGGITVEFVSGVNIDKAVDEVERTVDTLTDLPTEAEEIRVAEFEPKLPVIMVSVFGDADEEYLKQAIRRIRDDLKTLSGMGEILTTGVRDYEIRVDVSHAALLEHGMSLPQVAASVRSWLADVPGGTVRSPVGNVNFRTQGVPEQAETILDIVVKAESDGQSIRVRDIGTVREDYIDVQLETRFASRDDEGELVAGPSSTLVVFKQGDQDIVAMAGMVRAYVDGVMARDFTGTAVEATFGSRRRTAFELGRESATLLPPGIAVSTHSDLARFVEGRMDLLTRNAMWGAVLVFGTLLLFLNWRAAFWVGVGLTTALSGTLLVMLITGITLNLLTMFGLIVVLGLLVDDAIVVAENIQARHDRNEPSLQAAIRGTEQVFWPVVATVMTSIVAFMPLMFVRGQIGDLLGALPMVVACALFMSLVESVLILPSHMGHSLIHRDRAKVGRTTSLLRRGEAWRDRIIFEKIVPAYEWLLRLALRERYVAVCIALATLIGSLGMIAGGRVAFTFMSSSDSETIVVDVRLPIGAAIQETKTIVQRIEAAALAQSEVRTVSASVGESANIQTGQAAASATHLAQMFVELHPVESRDRESQQVIASIRETVGPLDGVDSVKYMEIQGGFDGPAITIQVTGDDEAEVASMVAGVRQLLAEQKGVFDITDDNFDGQREVQVRLRPGAAALGFTVANVAEQVRAALFGAEAHVFSAKQEDIEVRVRLDEASRRNLGAIENMWIVSPAGVQVPLAEIAELVEGTSYATLHRIDRQRAVTVTADTAPEANPEEIVASIAPELNALADLHPGIGFTFGGRQREMARAFASLPMGMGAACVLIYVILAWLFSSYTQPLAVMLAIPFGVIGVVAGHYIMGYTMTFLSLIGMVALSGIVVNDSLILVEFYNARRRDGESIADALVQAGRQRLRPIFLTTITTVLGLTPLMLEQSFQAKFLIPMAISIAFGLISATVLILLVLPCVIVVIDDIKAGAYYLWHGRKRSDAPPQPATAEVIAETD